MKAKILFIIGSLLLVLSLGAVALVAVPLHFGGKTTINIEKDESFQELSHELKENHIIVSELLFKAFMRLTKSDKKIVPGEYLLYKRSPLLSLSHRLTVGDYQLPRRTIFIPEGSTSRDIALILDATYPNFDEASFVAKAALYEGYLFPDTYDVFSSTSTDDIIEALTSNFGSRTKELQEMAAQEGKDWKDTVILASLLEEEGKTLEERKIISGILAKRLKEGINLQVDSTFRYINGKTSKELTLEDLKINSPYNTYVNPGLPKGPISNPGIQSLEAALHPTLTEYSYFLTGDDGVTHYSKTFEEHVRNKTLYIKS